MTDIQTYNSNNLNSGQKFSVLQPADGRSLNFGEDSHVSTNMKVKRPKVTPNDLKFILPSKKTFSDADATKKIQAINTDIYEGAKNEKEKHEFNTKRYFTIFGILALLTAALSYFRKGRGK